MSVFIKFIRSEIEEVRDAAAGRDDPAHKMIVRLCTALLVEYNIAEENELKMDHMYKELEMYRKYDDIDERTWGTADELTDKVYLLRETPDIDRRQHVADQIHALLCKIERLEREKGLLGLSKEETKDVYNCAIERSDEIVKAACGETDDKKKDNEPVFRPSGPVVLTEEELKRCYEQGCKFAAEIQRRSKKMNGEGETIVGCALCGKIRLKIRPGMPGYKNDEVS